MDNDEEEKEEENKHGIPVQSSREALCDKLDLRWGFGKFRPAYMQGLCNNPKAFLVWLCWFSMLQGFVVNGITNVNTSTFERRFNLKSKQSSLISSAYDVAAGIFVVPFSYYGAHGHQPRLIAFAAIVMSCGSVVMAIPQWTTEPYKLGNAIADKCDPTADKREEYCELAMSESYLSNYLYVFLLGQFLHGLGGTILYTLGIVFLDEQVAIKVMPMYLGILYTAALFGPMFGFLLGGKFLSIYVDWGKVDLDTVTVEPDDPRFVGAWWIGFIASAILLLTVFIGLLPYQKHLPQRAENMRSRVSQAHNDGSENIVNQPGFGTSIKDVPMSLKLLLRNPVNMLMTAAGVTTSILTGGYATFTAKFIESVFGQSAKMSAIIAGGVVIPGAAGGQMLGGMLCKRLDLQVKGMLKLMALLSLVTMVFSASCLATCPTPPFAGVTREYMDREKSLPGEPELNHTCNHYCWCTARSYEPVCGSDGIQYFSSCHAGCQDHIDLEDDKKIFTNCSCLTGVAAESWEHNSTAERGAEPGKCGSDCISMYIFLPCFMVMVLTVFMQYVPGMNTAMRCVPDKQRSFALGVRWLFVRFLGAVTGPIIFGYAFDRSCLVWQDKCDEGGACWIYNNAQLSLNLFIITLIVSSCSLLIFLLAMFYYKPPAPPSKRTSLTPSSTAASESEQGGSKATLGDKLVEYSSSRSFGKQPPGTDMDDSQQQPQSQPQSQSESQHESQNASQNASQYDSAEATNDPNVANRMRRRIEPKNSI